jgi:hypothetical protein
MSKFISVKCRFADGNSIDTRFRGTPEEAQKYYAGKVFNLGIAEDDMQKCIDIEIMEG